MNDSWMGLSDQVESFLITMGADRDPMTHRFYVVGRVVTGLGGEEIIVAPDCFYFVNGKARPLAAGLNGTSYGLRNVTVIL